MNIQEQELKERLNGAMESKKQEIAMVNCASLNCKIPQELSGFLTDLLDLTTDEEEALSALFSLDRKQIAIVSTLAMIANGRLSDFITLERNMLILKLSLTSYVKDNLEYRETSIDENEGNPEAMLDALIKMKEIMLKIHNNNE